MLTQIWFFEHQCATQCGDIISVHPLLVIGGVF
jgi:hypothetical protein